MWGPGYEISFEFYLNSDGGGGANYQWLFGVSSGADNIGLGQPVIFYNSGNLPMWFRLNDHPFGYVDPSSKSYGTIGDTLGLWYFPEGGTVTVEVQKWYKLSVSSIKENGKVSMNMRDNFSGNFYSVLHDRGTGWNYGFQGRKC